MANKEHNPPPPTVNQRFFRVRVRVRVFRVFSLMLNKVFLEGRKLQPKTKFTNGLPYKKKDKKEKGFPAQPQEEKRIRAV